MDVFRSDLMKGQRILVTGGGTGLGRAMSEHFLRLGAEVAICGRRKAICDATAQELMAANGGVVQAFGVDIRDAAAVDAMVETLFEQGGLTGLVNNAAGNFIARTEDLSTRGFDAIANIVMHGSFYVTQAVGKRWIAQRKAEGGWQPGGPMLSVVSIITSWVENGGPFVVPSAMSKAAVATMTRSLSTEWARFGVRLNAIGPGEIPTEGMSKRLMPGIDPSSPLRPDNPQGRHGWMPELTNLATFLMAPGVCDWLSGQLLFMDGAQYLANGGSFYKLNAWEDEDWAQARAAIEAQNAKDRQQRG